MCVCTTGECGPVDLPSETAGAQANVFELAAALPCAWEACWPQSALGALLGCIFWLTACGLCRGCSTTASKCTPDAH